MRKVTADDPGDRLHKSARLDSWRLRKWRRRLVQRSRSGLSIRGAGNDRSHACDSSCDSLDRFAQRGFFVGRAHPLQPSAAAATTAGPRCDASLAAAATSRAAVRGGQRTRATLDLELASRHCDTNLRGICVAMTRRGRQSDHVSPLDMVVTHVSDSSDRAVIGP